MANLDEFEQGIIRLSIERFCASLDKNIYNPVTTNNRALIYEFEIQAIFRRFVVIFEVDDIDAYALRFEEIVG